MSRSHFRHVVVDRAGNAIQDALVYVYEHGGSVAPGDLWDAEDGGTNVVTLLTNDQGEVEGWTDAPKLLDLFVTDNSHLAHAAGQSSILTTFSSFTETTAALPDPALLAIRDELTGLIPIAQVASGTPDGTKFVRDDGTLAVPGGSQVFNIVGDFGADPTGVADSLAAIQAADTACAAAGGGIVYYPPGIYAVSGQINPSSNTRHIGAGVGVTTVRMMTGGNTHVFNSRFCHDVEIGYMTVDGNRAGQSAGHGVRGEDIDGYEIHHLEIKEIKGDGIGLEEGIITRVNIHDCVIHDIEQDGVDCKNRGPLGNEDRDLSIHRVWVYDWALAGNADAAVDMRGPWQASHIYARNGHGVGDAGIRFRFGEAGDTVTYPNGDGAHRSSLTNFYVYGCDTGVSNTAAEVSISNGVADTCGVGFGMGGYNGYSIVGAHAVNCTSDGFRSSASGTYVGCEARGCGGNGFDLVANERVLGGRSTGNTGYGVLIENTATGVKVFGLERSGNTAGDVSQAGVDTLFWPPLTGDSSRTVIVRKTADQTVNNTASVADDNTLKIAIKANEVWECDWTVFYQAGTTADFKLTVTAPAGASYRWGVSGLKSDAADTTGSTQAASYAAATNITLGGAGATTPVMARVHCIVANGATADSIKLRWSQGTATVEDTTVLTNSFLVARQRAA